MSKTIYFISGGNRGIGLGFVKHISSRPDTIVITTARDPQKSNELQEWIKEHPNVYIVNYEASFSKDDTIKLAEEVEKIAQSVDSSGGLDVLIANAAIAQSNDSVLRTPTPSWIDHYNINVVGPIHLFQAFYANLLKRPTRKIAVISSGSGTISNVSPPGSGAYGQSKVALNYAVRQLSDELSPENFKVVSLDPGPVDTDMLRSVIKILKTRDEDKATSLEKRALTVDFSVGGMLKVIDDLNDQNSGNFFNYDGKEVLW